MIRARRRRSRRPCRATAAARAGGRRCRHRWLPERWRLEYRFAGSEKLLAIGPYSAVTLAKARAKRDEAKSLLADGIDPNEAKKDIQREIVAESVDTFGTIADS